MANYRYDLLKGGAPDLLILLIPRTTYMPAAVSYMRKVILSVAPDSLRVEQAVSTLNNFKTADRHWRI